MRIFIVDDSPIVRDRLVAILSELDGVEVAGQAEGAAEAIRKIRELRPDGVILDISLLRGNGIEVLKTIKKERPDVQVIILTLYPYPEYRESCMKAGADFFLDKSDGFEQLSEVLGALARKSGPEVSR